MNRVTDRAFQEGPLGQLSASKPSAPEPALIVFCHLRWNFVYQRPQHLISRLSKTRKVFFVEEPIHDAAHAPYIKCREAQHNVFVCEPHTAVDAPGFGDEQAEVIRPLLSDLLREQDINDYIVWYYSPMALPLAADLQPRAVIYDCMDELSAFANAPPKLLEREAGLLAQADAVFTGGPSLYAAKKDRHPHVYCFPSSVEAAHFGKARDANTELPRQASLPRPRLGFFGVIDERFDVTLFDEVARRRPDWQFVLVGPIVKIDPASLPVYSNTHYFGQQSYEDLPRFLAGWDVCLLPFARNESTRFISPTKTLEYMAAERMIVSTPITDVAVPYGDIVYLASTPDEFLEACEKALSITEGERDQRIGKMRSVLAATSWDTTAARMAEVCAEVLAQKARASRAAAPQKNGASSNRSANGAANGVSGRPTVLSRIDAGQGGGNGATRLNAPSRINAFAAKPSADRPVVVIGAGPTGLSAVYHLGDDAVLLEANDTVGGWCRSLEVEGFTFDYAGHIMFSNDPYVHKMYDMLLGDNVHWQDREAWIYSKNVFTRYPFQGSLYGLPPDVIKECIVGTIEARFGSLSPPTGPSTTTNGHAKNSNGAKCDATAIEDCCADGVMESTAKLGVPAGQRNGAASTPANFEEFIYKVWGRGIAKHFAIPYNRKLWSVPLEEMETSWLGGRVPMPDLGEMIEGSLKPAPKPMGPNARFGYPLRGGFQALMNGFLPHVQDSLRLGARVASISPRQRVVRLADGEEIKFDSLISTMPLPVLIRSMGDDVPREVQQAASDLRNVSVRCVHIGVGRENVSDKHWIYYPEETVFHRIFVQGNASPHCNPLGGFGLTCEITYSPYKPLPCDGEDLVRRCIDDCIAVGIIKPGDPIWATAQCDLPYAYVVYDHARPKNVALIRKWLQSQGITLAGRYSEWEYYNSDHAFLAGKKAAEEVRARVGGTIVEQRSSVNA